MFVVCVRIYIQHTRDSHLYTHILQFVQIDHSAAAAMVIAGDDSNHGVDDARIARIAAAITVFPGFPKPGISFQDVTGIFHKPEVFRDAIGLFVERYKGKGVTLVAGIEARGFFFAPTIALEVGAKFVPLRKPRKLPGDLKEYSLEYGTDKIEMQIGAVEPNDRAIIVDDLIATGGTLCAAVKLLERAGAEVVECSCVVELQELKGREKLGKIPVFVLVETN
ncbi:adenine phosphoribosyltransferase 1-like [Oryza glaberrima]|uniref:adenine phosphoribosyltransferase 1-like n=1 Tax=Oryza glaberrima TaxID=4538 RepID=UPI00224BEE04|nr:adenine phosphoribosyltransferase 1-like [Oryza glaberrima]